MSNNGENSKAKLEKKIDDTFERLKRQIMYFHDKELTYAESMVDWLNEIGTKNKIIHQFKNQKRDKEKVQRRRAEVF